MIENCLIHEEPGIKIYSFGGLHEVGRNCFAVYSTIYDKAIIIDCGKVVLGRLSEKDPDENELEIPESEIMPQFSSVAELWPKVIAVLITHIHLDHCGGIVDLYKKLGRINRPPVYSSRFSITFIKSLFKERNEKIEDETKKIIEPDYYYREDSDRTWIQNIACRMLPVAHSARQTRSYMLYLPKPDGGFVKILFVSDFKFADCKLAPGLSEKFKAIVEEEKPEIVIYDALYRWRMTESKPEHIILEGLEEMLDMAPKNLILSYYASNLDRTELIYDRVKKEHMFCYTGRTMKRWIELAKEAGWLDDPDGFQEGHQVLLKPMVMVTTGFNAAPYSVLSRLVFDHYYKDSVTGEKKLAGKPFEIRKNYSFGLMADPIPNIKNKEKERIKMMIEGLALQCPEGYVFITPNMAQMVKPVSPFNNIIIVKKLHASGHSTKLEQDLLLLLAECRVAIPYHYPMKEIKEDQVIED